MIYLFVILKYNSFIQKNKRNHFLWLKQTFRLKAFNFLIIELSFKFDNSVLKKLCLDIFDILKGKSHLKSLFFFRWRLKLNSVNFFAQRYVLLFNTDTIGFGSRHKGSDVESIILLSILILSSTVHIFFSSFIILAKSIANV